MALRTANPALNEKVFREARMSGALAGVRPMTIEGTINRCFVLLAVLLVPALYVWHRFFRLVGEEVTPEALQQAASAVMPFLLGGLVGGLIFALVTIFKPTWARVTAVLYAACEGLLIGGLSAVMEAQFPGVVLQAVALTFATLFGLLILYRARIIRVTEKFRMGIIVATGGIMLTYLLTLGLRFFGIEVPYIHGSGPVGIGFSVFVVIIAALNLVLDFDFIERGAEGEAPQHMEWYAAFGLLVTLVWLYIEILRLLAKINRR